MEWFKYLKKLDCKNLSDSVTNLNKKKELLVTVVWKVIGEIIEYCQ